MTLLTPPSDGQPWSEGYIGLSRDGANIDLSTARPVRFRTVVVPPGRVAVQLDGDPTWHNLPAGLRYMVLSGGENVMFKQALSRPTRQGDTVHWNQSK